MVVDDGAVKAQHSGLYGFLRDYYEKDLLDWQANVGRSHWDGAPFPRQRILDGLRAGRTVNVPTWSLSDHSRAGAPEQRAVVRPDDTITFSDENWAALWLEENDL